MLLPAAQPTHEAGLQLSIPGHPPFSEFLALNDRGYIAVDAGDEKATSAYVARPPYRAQDFKREQVPGASATTVTGLNDDGMAVGFYTSRRGNVTAFSERNGTWTHYDRCQSA